MDLPAPDDPRDPVAQRAADKRRLGSALRRSLAFVLLLVFVFGLQGLGDYRAFAVAAGTMSVMSSIAASGVFAIRSTST